MRVLTADTETSTYNTGNPFDPRNICVSIHLKVNDNKSFCTFYDDPGFITPLRTELPKCDVLVGHNIKFDLHWFRNVGIRFGFLNVWDTMVAEFILSGQTNKFASLNSLAERYGLQTKIDKVKEYWEVGVSTEDIPRELVEEYGNYDVDLTYQVYLCQLSDPRMTDKIKKLIQLAGQDLLILQEMEYNGLRYNKQKSVELANECQLMIDRIEKELLAYADITELNFNSDDQLSAYLYGGSVTKEIYTPTTSIIKSGPNKGKERTINRKTGEVTITFDGFFNPLDGTQLKKEGLYSSAADVLKQLKAPTKRQRAIVEGLLKRAELAKLVETYYQGLPARMDEMNWTDTIHGEYNQVVARTGRLSSSKPNMQNTPPEADALFESRYG